MAPARKAAPTYWIALFGIAATAWPAGEARCQTISFVSDPSCSVYQLNQDGSFGPPLGHAQCACLDPTWGCGQEALQNVSAGIPGSCEIWRSDVTGSSVADLQGAYFVTELDIPGLPTSGILKLAVDDFAEVSVNGNVLGTTGSITDVGNAAWAQGNLASFNLGPYLVTGKNTISIRAQNGPYWFSGAGCNPCNYGGNPAGLVFAGSVSYTVPVATHATSWGRIKTIYR